MPPVGHSIIKDTEPNRIGGSRTEDFVIGIFGVQSAAQLNDPIAV
jgi:hypothetical protein